MNTDLRKKVKNNFGTDFFTFMNNVDFRNFGKCDKIQRY